VAAKINPKDPLIFRNLAESYKFLKQPEKEKQAREKAEQAQAALIAEQQSKQKK
jgi:formiminotetrahydrofolate cyclodeaminase